MKARGKRKDNGEWVYGEVYTIRERKYILPKESTNLTDATEVIPNTVTRYSGLKDVNGTPIYEGDVYVSGESDAKYFVYFINGAFCGGRSERFTEPLGWTCDETDLGFTGELTECEFYSTIKVIGNKFDAAEKTMNINLN